MQSGFALQTKSFERSEYGSSSVFEAELKCHIFQFDSVRVSDPNKRAKKGITEIDRL
jgi:hypothetical protein